MGSRVLGRSRTMKEGGVVGVGLPTVRALVENVCAHDRAQNQVRLVHHTRHALRTTLCHRCRCRSGQLLGRICGLLGIETCLLPERGYFVPTEQLQQLPSNLNGEFQKETVEKQVDYEMLISNYPLD